MYLGHPYHLKITPDRSPTMSTHPVDMEDSKRDLQVSVTPAGLAKLYGCTEDILGESDHLDAFHMNQRRRLSVPEMQNAMTKVLESIEVDRVPCCVLARLRHDLPYQVTVQAQHFRNVTFTYIYSFLYRFSVEHSSLVFFRFYFYFVWLQ